MERPWSTVLAASQGQQHPQLEPDVSTRNFLSKSQNLLSEFQNFDKGNSMLCAIKWFMKF